MPLRAERVARGPGAPPSGRSPQSQLGVPCVMTPAKLNGAVVATVGDAREVRPLARHRGVVDLGQRLRVAEPAGDVQRLPCAPDGADAAVERAVVVERVAVDRRAEAVEEVPRLAEAPDPRRARRRRRRRPRRGPPARFAAEHELEPVRLARPAHARLVGARHRRVVVARAARELDRRGGAVRQAARRSRARSRASRVVISWFGAKRPEKRIVP